MGLYWGGSTHFLLLILLLTLLEDKANSNADTSGTLPVCSATSGAPCIIKVNGQCEETSKDALCPPNSSCKDSKCLCDSGFAEGSNGESCQAGSVPSEAGGDGDLGLRAGGGGGGSGGSSDLPAQLFSGIDTYLRAPHKYHKGSRFDDHWTTKVNASTKVGRGRTLDGVDINHQSMTRGSKTGIGLGLLLTLSFYSLISC